MLNIFKSKINKKEEKKYLNENIFFNGKDFPSSTREWKNSVYFFNKNALSLIPEASKLTIKLFKKYLNLYQSEIENKIRNVKLHNKKKKLSLNKIFVNRGEFRHTHNKVIITLFVYNRQKINYLYKLNKGYLNFIGKKMFKQDLILIKNRGLDILNKEIKKKNYIKSVLVKNLTNKSKISTILNKNYEKIYYKNFLGKTLVKLILYLQYKQLIYINKSKFEYTYLKGLINFIKRIFNKNVEFNIINLKYFYLNSDIFTQPLSLKIQKNKGKLLKYFKIFIRKVKIPSKNLNYILNDSYTGNNKKNIKNLLFNIIKNVDPLNNIIYKLYLKDGTDNKFNSLKKTVIDSIKYKRVTGVRLEAKGRLSKRSTASRSLLKVRYKGNLKNGYSSYKSLSSVMLRGNFKSNLQYTNINPNSRMGTFGFKGWVSGS